MDLFEAIKTRRSSRHFEEREVSENQLLEIIRVATYSPYSGKSYPVEFVLVRDKETISKLVKDRFRMKNSPFHIVGKSFAEKQPDQVEKLTPPPELIVMCGNTQKSTRLSTLIPTVAISAGTIMLAGNAFGLDSCWMNVYDSEDTSVEKQVKSILGIPNDRVVLAMLMIGYGNKEVHLQPKELPSTADIIHADHW